MKTNEILEILIEVENLVEKAYWKLKSVVIDDKDFSRREIEKYLTLVDFKLTGFIANLKAKTDENNRTDR